MGGRLVYYKLLNAGKKAGCSFIIPHAWYWMIIDHVDYNVIRIKIKVMREVILYRGEDNYWIAECPSLPGCVSQGTTREDAIKNVKEAIEGYILALQDDGLPIPEERFEAMIIAV
jgi:predicted RNase H-like HicB family nuclease